MRQLLRVARIQLVNAPAVLGIPALVLILALLANVAIFGAVAASPAAGNVVSGAISSIYLAMMIVHLQTMTQMFPFSVSLSVTRKAFFGATVLVVLGQSIAYAVMLYVLKLIEQATNGWGIDLTFAALPFLVHDNPVLQVLIYLAPMLLLSFLGIWFGIVFKRWGQFGAWALGLGLATIGVAFVVVVSWQQWWPAVGRFLEDQPALALQAGYPLLITAVLAAAGYLTARRAAP